MWKKILSALLVVITIFTTTTFSYANRMNNEDFNVQIARSNSRYQVIKPARNIFATNNNVVLVSGKAPAETNVNIKVFGTTDLTRKKFNLKNLPKEKDYILISNYNVRVGSLGYFGKQINLLKGVNKVVITFRVGKNGPVVEKIIYVYDIFQARKSLNKMFLR